MKIIVPMAGMGKRMRPHTLTIPKPLIPIAGKPIVQRLVEDIAAVCEDKIDEIAFIIGDFGKEAEDRLIAVAESLGAKGTICHQDEALGTAHAIYCAKEALTGPVIVAFADTLFKADFKLDSSKGGTIWVQKVEDPRAFGVVKIDKDNNITDFVEKPEEFVSDLAIIGIYFFKDGDMLRDEIKYLLDNNITDKGEFQLTDALENMKAKGIKFAPGEVEEWLDCGNKNATVYTNQRILELIKEKETLVSKSAKIENSVIIEPCYIGENAVIKNAVVGPHVSIGANSCIEDSIVKNAIIQTNTSIKTSNIRNSMIGNFASYSDAAKELSIGDYCTQEA
ncbi:MAG: glucose-1-phosphate thymidylyltransferase [Sphingobacteriales bacterium]|jgi:glucose-1-phosphate thymidylyltransferase